MTASNDTELESLERQLSEITAKDSGSAKVKKPTEAYGKGRGSKSKSSRREILWTERVEIVLKASWKEFVEILRGLTSSDRPTRWMSSLFIVSFVLVVSVLGYSVKYYLDVRKGRILLPTGAEDEAQHIGEFLRKQAAEAKHKFSMLTLGTFTVELKPIPGVSQAPGVANMAEVEIVLQCDSKDTRFYIEANIAQTRNQLTNVFTAIDRDEIMTREGKRRIKKLIIEKLNLWLPKGKIEDLFFSKLILS